MAASSVICFKNGYSFVSVGVSLGGENGEGQVEESTLGPVPNFAVHGTVGLQAWSPDKVQILSLARRKEEDLPLSIPTGGDVSMGAFLEANLGRVVMVGVLEGQGQNSGTSYHQGKVKWVQPREQVTQGSRMAILEMKENKTKRDKLIDCSKLVGVERLQDHKDEEAGSVVARYKRMDTVQPVMATLSYLTQGLAWAPNYSLVLTKGAKTLSLEGQATILCDLPFFDGSPVDSVSLVAGQPKVDLQSLADPLTSGAATDAMDFVRQLGNLTGEFDPPPQPRGMRMMRSAPQMMCMEQQCNVLGAAPAANQFMEGIKGGEAVEDFFHYQLMSVPLKHDQPLRMPFIKQCTEVEYEDIYFLDLDHTANRNMSVGGDEENSVEVKHAITFKNPTGQTLTAGPVSVLAQEEIQGHSNFMVQGTMKFTSPDRPVTVEITRTFDVQANYVIETGKERRTEQISKTDSWTGEGNKYADVISKKGKVTIKNGKNMDIKCKIEHNLQGHVTKSEPAPKEQIERPSRSYRDLNPVSKLTWEVSVPAESQVEINIEYDIKMYQMETKK